jgi:amino acid transporter
MGKLEDIMVYTKLIILFIISLALIYFGNTNFHTFTQTLAKDFEQSNTMNILIVASVTFVAYEGFQLVINAVKEMEDPDRNIPKLSIPQLYLLPSSTLSLLWDLS